MRKSIIIGMALALIAVLIPFAFNVQASFLKDAGEKGGGNIFHVRPLTGDAGAWEGLSVPDAMDIITFTGTTIKHQSTWSAIGLQLLCGLPAIPSTPQPTATGTPEATPTPSACSPMDISIHVTLQVTWEGYNQPSQSMDLVWGTQAEDDSRTRIGKIEIPCTNITVNDSGSGVCSYDDYIKINSNNINWNVLKSQLYIEWNYEDGNGGGGATFTVNYLIVVSDSDLQTTNCSGQFNLGNPIGSFILQGSNSVGVNLRNVLGQNYPAPGQWFAIRINSGYWLNNGNPTQLHSLAYLPIAGGSWAPLSGNSIVGCEDDVTYTYYAQMQTNQTSYLRVNDTDGNFAANSGTLNITIYTVTAYNPYSTGCELQYKVGDLIEQKSVDSTWENGYPLASPNPPYSLQSNAGEKYLSTRYYMLETLGGPANTGGLLSWAIQITTRATQSSTSPIQWYDTNTAPYITCVRNIDSVGHVRIYFAMDEETDANQFTSYFYSVRVKDDPGSFVDNSGSISYRLYAASFMQASPPGGVPGELGCLNYTHDSTATASITVLATWADGYLLPTLQDKALYALLITDGPWKDNGSNKYSVQISDDNGSTWAELKDYDNLICTSSQDGNHVLIYFYGATGKIWRVRVNDGDNNFVNNSLSIGVNIYTATANVNLWPKCSDTFKLKELNLADEDRKIPGNMEAGKDVPQIVAGQSYAINITNEAKWYEYGTSIGLYLTEISDDGGTTWTTLNNYGHVVCGEKSSDGRVMVYFTAQSNNYKLRVHDGDNNFLTNTGNVYYQLFETQDWQHVEPGPSPNPGDGGKPGADWVIACQEKYQMPNSYIAFYPVPLLGATINIPIPRIAEWLLYIKNIVVNFFAWCPQHTNALLGMRQLDLTREPLASIYSLLNFVRSFQTIITAYQSSGGVNSTDNISQEPSLFSDSATIGNGGGSGEKPGTPSTTNPWDIFMVGSANGETSIWYGQKLDMASQLGKSDFSGLTGYTAVCTSKFTPLWGIGSNSFCSFMTLLRYSSIVSWVLYGLDVFMAIWFLLIFFPHWITRVWNIVTGNKTSIRGMANYASK